MKILVLTDTHIRGTTPRNRLDDFPSTLKEKLLEVKQIIQKQKIDLVLHGGDLFDRPDTAPSVVSDFIQILREFKVPIYIVAGNHDLYGHNPNTISRTMLGLLNASGIVNLLSIEQDELIELNEIKLQLSGSAYHYDLDGPNRLDEYLIKKQEEVDYAINIVHGMLLPRPFPIDLDYTLIDNIKETEADITITGHYHTGFGIKELTDDKYCLNPGSLVRIGAYSSELERCPQVAIIELTPEEIDIQLYKLTSARDGNEVLDRSQIELNEYRQKKLAGFVQDIESAGEFNFMEIDKILEELAENQNLGKEIKEQARERIAKAREKLS
ncbi:metallophosphoesterase family protein [Selenihalanaerobacter shriftii]|uniref:DNA repair exonuclease SbcCD nuclease subunit n=1 Tax=Selenihalanaerobacter shriftii TaxID=142842 RepID=A0A1T4JM02_9FIRM|nr:metallophosphoesterase [Selenihalanaerobacter shriftii]SJZ31210.1 DNA repair exonuclease SbcCD nuclease subunit [Selenihalanaerobacter shriftii]